MVQPPLLLVYPPLLVVKPLPEYREPPDQPSLLLELELQPVL